ncbi:hypothetical protein [Winogradskyella forsetii]|uniref:hypothetical protein n=1 Tax=Winogradskyella forsetii TaxID=2686077 RepID=UPI0015BB7C2E|nr:hypothetical protein [Winogradskyella forsetii]
MKNIIIILALLSVTTIYSQSFDEVFTKFSKTKKETEEYQVNLDYKLYKGVKGTRVYENYSGMMAIHNGTKYQEVGAMKHIEMPNGFIKLNTEEKAMMVGLSSVSAYPSLEEIDPNLIYTYYNKGEFEEKDGLFKISFNAKEYSSLQTSRMEIHIDKKTFHQKKVVIYYSVLKDFSFYDENHLKNKTDESVDFPRLEISYSEYKSEVQINKSFFLQDSYIEVTPSKIVGVNQYKDFEIILAQ